MHELNPQINTIAAVRLLLNVLVSLPATARRGIWGGGQLSRWAFYAFLMGFVAVVWRFVFLVVVSTWFFLKFLRFFIKVKNVYINNVMMCLRGEFVNGFLRGQSIF